MISRSSIYIFSHLSLKASKNNKKLIITNGLKKNVMFKNETRLHYTSLININRNTLLLLKINYSIQILPYRVKINV